MASIGLDSISKRFGHVVALRDLSLVIEDGEFVALLGPSGCGKSTLLRLLAGLETPDTGTVRVGGRDVTRIDPSLRDLAFVFQSYALYPHKTVRDNITFPLRMRGPWQARVPLIGRLSPASRRAEQAWRERARDVAASLGLDGLLDRKPAALSGGQRQRVALARALIREPAAFLLDEPLSNLDARLRADMRGTIVDLHRQVRTTFVYVTHDQAEAMSMADRIVLLRDGAIQQAGPPLELYDNPATRFVAEFVGAPTINMLPLACHVCDGGAALDVTLGGVTVAAPPRIDAVTLAPGMTVDLGCRPHDIALCRDADASLHGTVLQTELHGDATFVTMTLGAATTGAAGPLAARLLVRVPRDEVRRLTPGERVPLRIDWRRALLFGGDERRLRELGAEGVRHGANRDEDGS